MSTLLHLGLLLNSFPLLQKGIALIASSDASPLVAQSASSTCARAHTHTHTLKHACMAYIPTHTRRDCLLRVLLYMYLLYAHTSPIHTHTCTHTHTFMCVCECVCVCACKCVSIVYTCVHAYLHMYNVFVRICKKM